MGVTQTSGNLGRVASGVSGGDRQVLHAGEFSVDRMIHPNRYRLLARWLRGSAARHRD